MCVSERERKRERERIKNVLIEIGSLSIGDALKKKEHKFRCLHRRVGEITFFLRFFALTNEHICVCV